MCNNEKEARMFIDLVITAFCEGLATQEQMDKAKALKDKFYPGEYRGWRWMYEDNPES